MVNARFIVDGNEIIPQNGRINATQRAMAIAKGNCVDEAEIYSRTTLFIHR